ncbi:chymotrypsin-1-like [Maniola jurtina]|uniref:chymotrypsin-1-like n=1 Tax=Maniola jurtina TaxID=191418 RepID=UPI001E68FD3C|nr:chymotrypsin-1-like [Maniola jurtina]
MPEYTYLQRLSRGLPLETAQPNYDVKSFFSSRIVGGVDAPPGHARHMVALIYKGWHMRWLVCGGSIITKRHVLSAAHCIEPYSHWGQLSPDFIGVYGTYHWNSTDTEVTFSGYVNHPDWDWNTIKNDIGILCTVKEFTFNEHVGPITLNFDYMSGGQHASVTGWGRLEPWGEIPDHMQMLDVTTLSPKQCYLYMKYASQSLGPALPVDPKVEICTFHSKGHGMCNGDSGSPLFLKHTWEQIGIVSWGFPCALGAPDVFTRLGAFKKWIELVTGKYFV